MCKTYLERLQVDPDLQAFVAAEVARAGIALDTLRYQRDRQRQQIATLTRQLDEAQVELRRLRRRDGRAKLSEVAHG